MQIEQLKPIIEAALLAASQPLTVAQLGELFVEEDEVDREAIARVLEALAEDCAGRGIELKEVASGFRYQVRQDVHPWVSRMWTEKPSRYSRALLETLALIAYRQPITRPEIEQIRGVVVSSNIIKTLEEREWIRVVGHRDVPGRPALFGTTRAFLDYFNLKSLDELPPLSEIRDMEDPQLRLDQEPLPPRVIKDLPVDPEQAGDPLRDDPDGMHDATADALQGETPPAENQAAGEAGADVNIESAPPIETTAVAPDDDAPVSTPSATADEAAAQVDVESDAAEQDIEEYRA
ncbi:SMC-Scp complex subunit ScpB [Frateuria terrea]|uniref:Segregation and condensation protein B n=1 Tax=Frateuria terrea TaxID=529704 RepID=A0A1H6Q9Z5_9GAMM|nr:SMC-Scp complex subunit ScpB [Frateuria terrea]SEI38666.1 segregation and condensation protein B [Frateuria terrea]SFP04155.1 segregation and condensation protein B [Frateuria terrea]